MKIDIKKMKELINTEFGGSQKKCAKSFKVSREYLNKALKKSEEFDASPKICVALIAYCEKNNLNYKDYIFLE